jgi:N-acetylneuraminic acid mutarotase
MVAMHAQTNVKLLEQATELGRHSGSSRINLTVSLKLHNLPKLKAFLEQLQDPHSPVYRQFLTPRQFTARFGPTKADVARVISYLKSQHIKVLDVSRNRLLIHTQATTERYEHAFGIFINNYKLNGRHFFSTEAKPMLPRSLAPLVANILGLNNAKLLKPFHQFSALNSRATRSTNPYAAAPPPTTTAILNPFQVAIAYDWPDITDTNNAKDTSIAIITASSSGINTNSSADTFWSAYGLPSHEVNVTLVDGDQGLKQGMGETILDITYAGAMAPGAKLNLYVCSDAKTSTFIDAYNKFVNDNASPVMTVSWGATEPTWGDSIDTVEEIFMQAAVQNISMFAASGDSGASSGTSENNVATFPSSSKYITSANGTELTISDTSGTYGSERAWNNTGGAISQAFDEPDWQRGRGVPQNGHRNNSDLSLNAGPLHPYYLYFNGQWFAANGTSAVAPILAGLFAIAVGEKGGRLGQSNKLIYDDVNAGNYDSDFHDVTTGCNGKLPDGSNSCAKADWDHPTGWGSIRANSFLSHVGIQGPHGTLKGTVTDAASGAPVAGVKITANPGDYVIRTLKDGSFSRVLPAGDYTVTASSYGYAEGSASVTISDGGTSTQDFSLTAEQKVTLSGTVKDGSYHGYGLYAEINITTPEFGRVAQLWTDPTEGTYSIDLPKGSTYTMEIAPAINGYQSDEETVDLNGDTTEDVSLALTTTCTAPGYHFVNGGFSEDFNGSQFPPEGWTVVNNNTGSGEPIEWRLNNSFNGQGNGNYTGGTGTAATANSNHYGRGYHLGSFDTSLVTPPIPVTSLSPHAQLNYLGRYVENYKQREAFDLDVRANGGAWKTLLHWTINHGARFPFEEPGEKVKVDLGPYLPETGNVQLRWRYYQASSAGGTLDWYAQIDDITTGACEPISGNWAFGQVTDTNTGEGIVGATVSDDLNDHIDTTTNPADPNFADGSYLLFVPAGDRMLSATEHGYTKVSKAVTVSPDQPVIQDFALSAPKFATEPTSFTIDAMVNNQTTKTLTLENIGAGNGVGLFNILDINVPAPSTAAMAIPRRTVPLKNPELADKGLAWIRAHAKSSGRPPLAPSLAIPSDSNLTDWQQLANLPKKLGDNATVHDPITGKVYSIDGITNDGGFLAALYVYDPVTDAWSQLASPPVGREAPAAVFIDGKIYVTNGSQTISNPLAELDIYNIKTGEWSTGKPNPNPTRIGSAGAVVNGKMYVVGGCLDGYCHGVNTVQVYDPGTGSWSSAAPYPQGVTFAACGGIKGKLYCAGGDDPQGPAYKTGYVYDPSSNSWSPIADLPMESGVRGALYAVANGQLLLSGGVVGGNPLSGQVVTNQGEAYDPVTDSWYPLPNAPEPVYRGGGACGFYRAGGLYSATLAGFYFTDKVELLPGYGQCGTEGGIPYLTLAPQQGTIAQGASKQITLTFDGSNQEEFTTSQAYLKVAGSLYGAPTVPLTVHWIPQPVSLALTGQASAEKLRKGNILAYTLKVQNQQKDNHGAATRTKLTYNLPDGVTFITAGGDADCSAPVSSSSSAPAAATGEPPAKAVACDFEAMAAGTSKTETITVKTTQAGTLKSEFSLSAREPNDSDNNTLILKSTVIGNADVSATAPATAAVGLGSTSTVHMQVANAGPDTATDVTFKLKTSGANIALESAKSDNGTCASAGNTMISCSIGDVQSGASVDVDVKIKGADAGTSTVLGQLSTSSDDSNPGNAFTTTQVNVHSTADLGVTGSGATMPEGGTGQVQMVVSNSGPDTATGVTFTIHVGDNVSIRKASSSQGACSLGKGAISCDIGLLDSGSSAKVSLTAFGTHAGSATVQGQAITTANDPDQSNNVATAKVTISAANNGGNKGGGGGGSLGWFALVALLGLASGGFCIRRRQ